MVYLWIMRENCIIFSYIVLLHKNLQKVFQFRKWNKSKDGINQVNYYALNTGTNMISTMNILSTDRMIDLYNIKTWTR